MSTDPSNSDPDRSKLPVAKRLEPQSPPPMRVRDGKPVAEPADAPIEDVPGEWAAGQDDQAERGDPPPSITLRQRIDVRESASFMVSFIFHASLLLLLSIMVGVLPTSQGPTLVVATSADDGVGPEDLESPRVTVADQPDAADSEMVLPPSSSVQLKIPTSDLVYGARQPIVPSSQIHAGSEAEQMMQSLSARGGGFQGRSGDQRAQLLASGGGNDQSERAVALGLAWLAEHQWQDGGWRLGLTSGPCEGRCRNSGEVATTTGATGLALLPFLGAGHTHLEGEYRDVVFNGLYYLKNHLKMTPNGADLQEGTTMYAHGIATIALCEAYAMTQDDTLRVPAQRAIDFICHAQHSGGGWRYYPGQPGDTTVFGWQMMALKSAAMSGLDVPSPVIKLAERFLDSVQTANGAFYGYVTRGKKPSTTAVGLLIRMYTGWPRDDSNLQRGVEFLAKEGPSKKDMYLNYYATQVVQHYGGPLWPQWNVEMRDYLIERQATEGHERGSWFFADQHGDAGGRVYTTAMCTMILEVYYRHMPLYGSMAVEEEVW